MNRDTETVLRDVGVLLHIPGVMALVSLPVCVGFGEGYAIVPFGLTAVISLIFGQLLYRSCRRAKAATLKHAMLIVALSWAIVPLPAMIPFIAIASHLATFPDTPQTITDFQSPLNALFEAVSGFTSTGLSMARDASQLPHTLQWCRSFTEWIGGVGIIVLMLCVLEPTSEPDQLYQAAGWNKKIAPTVQKTVRQLWLIYLLYTGLSILLLRLVGMPWWEAVNHGMAGIATGGFAITGNSFTAYPPLIQFAAVPIMIVGAISFVVHAQLLTQHRWSALWSNRQHQLLWLLLGLGTIALLLQQSFFSGSLPWMDSLFQWVSALSTCGFNTVKIQDWSSSARLVLTLAMIVGATSGSTCGGLKLSRVVTLGQAIVEQVHSVLQQSSQQKHRATDDQMESQEEAHQQLQAAAVLATLLDHRPRPGGAAPTPRSSIEVQRN